MNYIINIEHWSIEVDAEWEEIEYGWEYYDKD